MGRILQREREKLFGETAGSISVVIGSEGGFSLSEAERIKNTGAIAAGLGKRILRTETASGFALSCIVFFTELEGIYW